MAKYYAAEIANQVAYEALQLHGGYGFIKDYPIERISRDARILSNLRRYITSSKNGYFGQSIEVRV